MDPIDPYLKCMFSITLHNENNNVEVTLGAHTVAFAISVGSIVCRSTLPLKK